MISQSRLQTATYLLAVCPFSIAFLVFMNSAVSFVVTDLINLEHGHGNAVGTLGFADELLALVACPLWGLISDRIGARYVSTIGYSIVAVSLVLFVQAKNVYPQLLLGRLLFCLGGSAVATMVTALLPAITANHDISKCPAPGVAAPIVCTPDAGNTRDDESPRATGQERSRSSAPRLAGYVGMFTGCGALIALLLFLPLPVRFQKAGYSPAQAIKFSFYTVGLVALIISVVCFFGLRGLQGDEGKSLKSLVGITERDHISGAEEQLSVSSGKSAYTSSRSYLAQLLVALKAGLTDYNIGLAYVGGFVARSSSVGISLFIPLYVNQYYRRSGLCHEAGKPSTVQSLSPNPGDIKQSCPRAYVVASILTGVSQLVALLCAPLFGYLSDKSRRYNFPLLMGSLLGTLSYAMLGVLPGPRISGSWSSAAIFVDMAFIGISQISAIVCSLAILSNGINGILPIMDDVQYETQTSVPEDRVTADRSLETINESTPLVSGNNMYTASPQKTFIHVKGSIAGMYSLWGGAGILILTKVGGIMFDKMSPHSPFYILAGFNGLLLIIGLVLGLRQHWSKGRCH
ncbi:Major facilitator superfamily [Trichophyton rubrum]|nr:Major facilitator superfamily [Trichophyton rubrum]